MAEAVAAAIITSVVTAGTAAMSAKQSRDARRDMKDERKKQEARQATLEQELASRQKVNREGLQMQDVRRRQQLGALQSEGEAQGASGVGGYKSELGA